MRNLNKINLKNMNPFIVSGFSKGKYFCNRKNELNKLQNSYINNRNVTLISLRRMGKTSLVLNLFEKIKKDADCLFIDIFPAQNLSDFVNIFANSVYNYFGKTLKNYFGELTGLVKSLGATISINDITGNPELSFGLIKPIKAETNLNEIINFLEKRKKRVLIAFDEFQQILNFTEKNTEAILRTNFQKVSNIGFIFSGSNKGMMESLFSAHSKPFYQSSEILYLNEIPQNEYKDFIIGHIKNSETYLTSEQVDYILSVCRGHTYYIQYFCNRLYSINFNGKKDNIVKVFEDILTENEPVFINYRNMLTNSQWNLLKAIALENTVKEPTSNQFIKKYNLGGASTVQRGLKSLLKDEMITFYNNEFIVSDVFLFNWFKMSKI